ncbi:AMMECR1 family protein [Rutstroemia sp. NJR-2017a BVV2]|nr:AMMECR1 family protein [Rutstroemia sp. NJR-2017a BVV2]
MATVEHCLYCFETLSAHIENRPPMTLSEVQQSWATYPKGLELNDDDDDNDKNLSGAEELSSPSAESEHPNKPTSLRNPSLQRITRSSSGTSTPSSSSTTSSANSADTSNTTPSSSTTSFTPIGVSPNRSSQPQSTSSNLTQTPLFITFNTLHPSSPHNRHLRGCIGTFHPRPISSGLASYTLKSAFEDDRFPPISKSELPRLEVCVTLLTDFETCSQPLDWELGVHGITLTFYYRSNRYEACYLPDVAVEQGWDKEETVVSCMRKAGWRGRTEKWREVGDLKVVRFQGRKESVEWEEYAEWRKWVIKQGGK